MLLAFAIFAVAGSGMAYGQKKDKKKKKKNKDKTEVTTETNTETTENQISMTNEKDSLSYAIGMNIGDNVRQQGLDINPEILAQGVMDAYKQEGKMSPEAAAQLIQKWQMEQQSAQQAKAAQAAEENKAKGLAFLAENASKDGVQSHESGLQYKVLKEGNGRQPTIDDEVTLHYAGKLIDGREFDSSIARGEPITFSLKQLIRGWQIAVPMMKEGSEWEIYVPSELGYGAQGAGQMIGPNETLIFFIQLLSVPSQD